MNLAIAEARRAGARGEVPVGAVIADRRGLVLAAAGNASIGRSDPAAHAEIMVMRAAGKKLGNYRLTGATIYVTLEPCAMCAAAMVQARIEKLVFGAADPRAGAVVSLYNIGGDSRLNHQFVVEQGVMAAECAALLTDFFREKRGRIKEG